MNNLAKFTIGIFLTLGIAWLPLWLVHVNNMET